MPADSSDIIRAQSRIVTQQGEVNGYNNVGGLVGLVWTASDKITNCYATGDVTGSGYASGLVGYNKGTITNCYATGDVTRSEYASGLIGYNKGTITNCYDVRASGVKTGLIPVRENQGGTIKDVYILELNQDLKGNVGEAYNFVKDSTGVLCETPANTILTLENNTFATVTKDTKIKLVSPGTVNGRFTVPNISTMFKMTFNIDCQTLLNVNITDTNRIFNNRRLFANIIVDSHETYIVSYSKAGSTDSYWYDSKTKEVGGSLKRADTGIYKINIKFHNGKNKWEENSELVVTPYTVVFRDLALGNLTQTGDLFDSQLITVAIVNRAVIETGFYTDAFTTIPLTNQEGIYAITFHGNYQGTLRYMTKIEVPQITKKSDAVGFVEKKTEKKLSDNIEAVLTLKGDKKPVNLKIKKSTNSLLDVRMFVADKEIFPIIGSSEYLLTLNNASTTITLKATANKPFKKTSISLSITEAKHGDVKIPVVGNKLKIEIVDNGPIILNNILVNISPDSIKRGYEHTIDVASQIQGFNKLSSITYENSTAYQTAKGGFVSIRNNELHYSFPRESLETAKVYGMSDKFTTMVSMNTTDDETAFVSREVTVMVYVGAGVAKHIMCTLNMDSAKALQSKMVQKSFPTPYGLYFKPYEKLKIGKVQKPKKMAMTRDKNVTDTARINAKISLVNPSTFNKERKKALTSTVMGKGKDFVLESLGVSLNMNATYKENNGKKDIKVKQELELGAVLIEPPVIDSIRLVTVKDTKGKDVKYILVRGKNMPYYYISGGKQKRSGDLKGYVEYLDTKGNRKQSSISLTNDKTALVVDNITYKNGIDQWAIFKYNKVLDKPGFTFECVIFNGSSYDTIPMPK